MDRKKALIEKLVPLITTGRQQAVRKGLQALDDETLNQIGKIHGVLPDFTDLDRQLTHAIPRQHFLFTATHAVNAVQTLLDHHLITIETLVVFDLDDTLVVSNSDERRGIRPRETVLPDFTLENLQDIFGQIKSLGAGIAIVSGRNSKQLPQTRAALTDMELYPDELIFTSSFKADKIIPIAGNRRVIYVDDWLIGAAGDVAFDLIERGYRAIGIKVGSNPEDIPLAGLTSHEKARYGSALAPGANRALFPGL